MFVMTTQPEDVRVGSLVKPYNGGSRPEIYRITGITKRGWLELEIIATGRKSSTRRVDEVKVVEY